MLKILVADKYNIHRIGLVQILIEAFPGAKVEEANDLDSLFKKCSGHKWDIIISGFIVPVEMGVDTIQQIKKTDPGVTVAVCGLDVRKSDITCLLNAGAAVFVDKAAKAPVIAEAIRKTQPLEK